MCSSTRLTSRAWLNWVVPFIWCDPCSNVVDYPELYAYYPGCTSASSTGGAVMLALQPDNNYRAE